MKQTLTVLTLLIFATASLASQDLRVLHNIRKEATRNSQVEAISYRLLDYVGPRLTGSDGAERGYIEAQKIMQEFDLSNPQVIFARKWHRGGWDIEKAYTAMVTPYYIPIFPALVGWSGGSNGLQKAEVVLIEAADSAELVTKYRGKLRGKIVLMPSTQSYTISFGPSASRHSEESLRAVEMNPVTVPQPRIRNNNRLLPVIQRFVREQSPLAIVNESGEFNNPGLTFYNHTEGDRQIAPEFNATVEIHGLMERLIKSGEKVEMEIDIRTRFSKNRPINNVIAEIPGSDPKLRDEIILIGAHLDSYHLSPGAGDDGAGCIAMLEAMRILKTIGVAPRRTIRIALWGGEEVGIHGSSGYVEQFVGTAQNPLVEYDKISLYLNSDYGPGKFRGIYTQGNEMVNPLFREWLKPFEEIGCSTVSNRSVTSTDHIPFDAVGIPAFQFIQDGLEWGRGSHRATDFSDRLIYDDIRHNAVVVAWMAYCAAMQNDKTPRK